MDDIHMTSPGKGDPVGIESPEAMLEETVRSRALEGRIYPDPTSGAEDVDMQVMTAPGGPMTRRSGEAAWRHRTGDRGWTGVLGGRFAAPRDDLAALPLPSRSISFGAGRRWTA